MNDKHKKVKHKADFCVVGGGLAGLLAAVQAARKKLKVVLIQDRPVLGGNASSEIRMWPLGCHGSNNRESGIFEEINLENMHRNPERNYSIWDSVLYGLAKGQENLTVLFNCSVYDARVNGEGKRILAVEAWQLTTYTVHTVEAEYFADCSGDSILAPLVGAAYVVGREASADYHESIQPSEADRKTMGLTCMMQARETDRPVPFIPPAWAKVFPDESMFKHRSHHMSEKRFNYWWIELGGDRDSLYDTESIRDDLLATAFGVWDHIKNYGDHGAENWELDWVAFLPGKRESRRYQGAYVLNENDILAEGRFEDLVAYGGWTMDDHDPAGFHADGPPNAFHPAPAPYGIPYRSLYSENMENLFFAGRNISATHAALSSTRVMATCSVIGQAVGMAAAVAYGKNTTAHGVYREHIDELKQALLEADCYLPFNRRQISSLTAEAGFSSSDPQCKDLDKLRNGYDRPIGAEDNGCRIALAESLTIAFKAARQLRSIRLVFDSDLDRVTVSGDPALRNLPMICNRHLDFEPFGFPLTMTREYKLEYRDLAGNWQLLQHVRDNHQRLRLHEVSLETTAIRFIPLATYGDPSAHLFAVDVK